MPKVKCFEIDGLSCWFWSNDHAPPHFHVKKNGEWEMRVKFTEAQMFEMVWGGLPKRKILQEIEMNVNANRARLLVEWEESGKGQ
jgi:hypothetical protein